MPIFLEDYTLLDELGQGGFATVYKVRHNNLGYIRAIRVLNAVIAHGEDDKTYQKFLEECRLLLRLGNGNHPNIVHIYQPLLKAQRAIVEMDYVDGQNLYNYLKSKSSFVETDEVLRLLADIGSALAYCHEDIYRFCLNKDEDNLQDDPADGSKLLIDENTRQRLIDKYRVIHNDIHSGNIMRREDGRYVLLDFGLAIEGDSVIRSSRRKNGAPEFKAPEKWDNESILTAQSDIYSFGIVLYEFLAGRVPFPFDKQNSNSSEAEYFLCQAHKNKTPEPIYGLRKEAFKLTHPNKEYVTDYPEWLEELIMKCLEKDTDKRFKNGKELYEFMLLHTSQAQKAKEPAQKENEKNRQTEALLRDSVNQVKGEYERRVSDLLDRLQKADNDVVKAHKDISVLRKANEELTLKVQQLMAEIKETSINKTPLEQELQMLKKNLKAAEQHIGRLEKENRELMIFASKGKRPRMYSVWRALAIILFLVASGMTAFYFTTPLTQVIEYSADSEKAVEKIMHERDSLQKAVTSLQNEIKTAGSEGSIDNSASTAQIERLQKRISDLEKSERLLKDEKASLNNRINERERQIKNQENEINALRKALGM